MSKAVYKLKEILVDLLVIVSGVIAGLFLKKL